MTTADCNLFSLFYRDLGEKLRTYVNQQFPQGSASIVANESDLIKQCQAFERLSKNELGQKYKLTHMTTATLISKENLQGLVSTEFFEVVTEQMRSNSLLDRIRNIRIVR